MSGCHVKGCGERAGDTRAEVKVDGILLEMRLCDGHAELVRAGTLTGLSVAVEPRSCTGLAASWCPIHGDCICPVNEQGERVDWNDPTQPGMNSPLCPLHAAGSDHGLERSR